MVRWLEKGLLVSMWKNNSGAVLLFPCPPLILIIIIIIIINNIIIIIILFLNLQLKWVIQLRDYRGTFYS